MFINTTNLLDRPSKPPIIHHCYAATKSASMRCIYKLHTAAPGHRCLITMYLEILDSSLQGPTRSCKVVYAVKIHENSRKQMKRNCTWRKAN
ncbi:hypothetical protein L2E82_45110 [Cichorium intybus]|uniref:Uncharacterized protein n=1 Tax=Cichorium intybus TaxID=13427 RepID=A0ACB8ZWH0_CICIN|nr:hypothetical protein L2E82_45110 [Cichorium intybus]